MTPHTNGNKNEDGLWTARRVAEYLEVAEGTVKNWAKAGRIPVVKVGSLNRFRKQDIDRWLDERTEGGR